MIRALIVDDQDDFRLLATLVVKRQTDMAVAAEARNGREALEALDRVPVDVVVLDEMMPDMDGLETAGHIRGRKQKVGLILCSAHVDGDVRRAAANAGIEIVLAKENVADLPDAIRRAAAS